MSVMWSECVTGAAAVRVLKINTRTAGRNPWGETKKAPVQNQPLKASRTGKKKRDWLRTLYHKSGESNAAQLVHEDCRQMSR